MPPAARTNHQVAARPLLAEIQIDAIQVGQCDHTGSVQVLQVQQPWQLRCLCCAVVLGRRRALRAALRPSCTWPPSLPHTPRRLRRLTLHAVLRRSRLRRVQACAAEVAAWLAGAMSLPGVASRLAAEPSLVLDGPAPLLARWAAWQPGGRRDKG